MQASEEVFYKKLRREIKQLKAKDEEHERLRKDVEETCDLIRTKGRVSKWRILNWLERALKGVENGKSCSCSRQGKDEETAERKTADHT